MNKITAVYAEKKGLGIEAQTQVQNQIEISSKPGEGINVICDSLSGIRKLEGVIGNIFKNATEPEVAGNKPDKIIEYAMLSTELSGCTEIIEQIFDVGSVECIISAGEDTKILCIANSENRISVFMTNTCDHDEIKRKLAQARVLYLKSL